MMGDRVGMVNNPLQMPGEVLWTLEEDLIIMFEEVGMFEDAFWM